jgi:hypothetical protein
MELPKCQSAVCISFILVLCPEGDDFHFQIYYRKSGTKCQTEKTFRQKKIKNTAQTFTKNTAKTGTNFFVY